ncbi:MAG: DUF1700 domain-containing protein [Agathobacter sp.]|nr:DUF1700 domain-containing protein [Agathobacter sp.]
MNRQEFFRQLESLLMNIPEQERADALAYYNDYFDEAGIENEQRVIQELGSPQKVAQSIIEDVRSSEYSQSQQQEENQSYGDYAGKYGQSTYQNYGTYQSQTTYQDVEKKKFKTWQIVLIVILLVVTFPIWIGLVAGLFGTLIGILGGLFGVLIGLAASALGLVIGGIAVVVAGLLCVIVNPLESVTCIGVGLILTAIGVLLGLLFVLLTFAWLPKLIKAIVGWIKALFHRNEGGNEI